MNQTPDELGKKILDARNRHNKNSAEINALIGMSAEKSGGAAMALRAGVEIVVAVLFGSFVGYWADAFFKTKPIFMIAMVFIGFVAGFLNIYRSFMGHDWNKKEDI